MKINILKKTYGSNIILEKLRFTIDQKGSIALVGLNGSGKSTLLKVISGICQNYTGDIDLESRKIASLIDGWGYYRFYTGREMMEYLLTDDEIVAAQEYLDVFKVRSYLDNKFYKYSLGMKQRLALVCTFAKKSDLLLLDEPINGLDPEGISDFKNIITKLKKEKTIIISTHILTDISSYCDQVFVLENHSLQSHVFEGNAFRFAFDNEEDALKLSKLMGDNCKSDVTDKILVATIKDDYFRKIIKLIAENSLSINSIDKVSNSIDYNLLEKIW